MLPALLTVNDRLIADLFDKRITHICKRRMTVHMVVCFHLFNAVLHHIIFIVAQCQAADNGFVALHNLRRRKAGRHSDILRMIFYLMGNGMDTAMYGAFFTEIFYFGLDVLLCRPDHICNQLFNSFVFCRADRNHRDPKSLRHQRNLDRSAVLTHFIHHIQRQNHRNVHFHKLQRQIEVSFDIGCVHNIDDPVRFFV